MNPPVTNIDHLVVNQMYAIYESMPLDDKGVDWAMLLAHPATFLGVGHILGDLVAVFRSEDRDPEMTGAG